MRVSGSGHRDPSESASEENPRVKKFRQKYRPGHVLVGVLLEYESPNYAWVLVDDIQILAWIQNNYQQGQRLFLLVENMFPEIVLKEVEYDSQGRRRISLMV